MSELLIRIDRSIGESRTVVSWNPRYLAYCIAHGATSPEDMLARDRMNDFTYWLGAMWAEWERAVAWPRDREKTETEHRAFDSWLADRIAA